MNENSGANFMNKSILNPSAHHCHAVGCTKEIKPELLMCLKHWRHVPREIQKRVWATYRPGQCDDKSPSIQWHIAADAAIEAVRIRLIDGRRNPLSKDEIRDVIKWAINKDQAIYGFSVKK